MRLALLILFAFSMVGRAATYYSDFVGGSNSNSGTSTNAPWKHAIGDPAATGGPAETALAPGDSMLFKRGVSYVVDLVGFSIEHSGTAETPITYGAYGTGARPIITSTDSKTTVYAFVAPAFREGIRFEDLHFYEMGGLRPGATEFSVDTEGCTTNLLEVTPGGGGIRFDYTCANVVFSNILFEALGTWTNSTPLTDPQSIAGGAISIEGGTNIVIQDCTIRKVRTGIRLQLDTGQNLKNVVIDRCDISDHNVWQIDVGCAQSGATVDGLYITRSRFYNKHAYDSGNWLGCGEKPHTDGIFLRNAGKAGVWTNVVVAHNFFYSDYTSGGGTAMIYLSEGGGGNIDMIGNVFNRVQETAAIFIGYTPRQGRVRVRLIQNTFLGTARPLRVTGTNRVIQFYGNLFVRDVASSSANVLNLEAFNDVESDFNAYWNPSLGMSTWNTHYLSGTGWPIAGGYKPLTAWQAGGYDANSLRVDPMLTDSTNTVPSMRNLRPAAGSPLINAGSIETMFPTLDRWTSYDALGNWRGASWDIGALEFGGVDPDPDPDPEPPPPSTNGFSIVTGTLTVTGQIQ